MPDPGIAFVLKRPVTSLYLFCAEVCWAASLGHFFETSGLINHLQTSDRRRCRNPEEQLGGLCGNGVVPLVAAHALRTLAAELLADG
jgi:hypothetical protein